MHELIENVYEIAASPLTIEYSLVIVCCFQLRCYILHWHIWNIFHFALLFSSASSIIPRIQMSLKLFFQFHFFLFSKHLYKKLKRLLQTYIKNIKPIFLIISPLPTIQSLPHFLFRSAGALWRKNFLFCRTTSSNSFRQKFQSLQHIL